MRKRNWYPPSLSKSSGLKVSSSWMDCSLLQRGLILRWISLLQNDLILRWITCRGWMEEVASNLMRRSLVSCSEIKPVLERSRIRLMGMSDWILLRHSVDAALHSDREGVGRSDREGDAEDWREKLRPRGGEIWSSLPSGWAERIGWLVSSIWSCLVISLKEKKNRRRAKEEKLKKKVCDGKN